MLDSFFDELCKIAAAKIKTGQLGAAFQAGTGLRRAMPWVATASVGGAGALYGQKKLQDAWEAYQMGRQIQQARARQEM